MRKLIVLLLGLSPFALLAVVAAIAAVSAAPDEAKRYLVAPVSVAHLRQ